MSVQINWVSKKRWLNEKGVGCVAMAMRFLGSIDADPSAHHAAVILFIISMFTLIDNVHMATATSPYTLGADLLARLLLAGRPIVDSTVDKMRQ